MSWNLELVVSDLTKVIILIARPSGELLFPLLLISSKLNHFSLNSPVHHSIKESGTILQ